jgi:hypothetical protein
VVSYWVIGEQPQTTQAGWHASHRIFHPLANVDSLRELEQFPFPDVAASGADEGLEQEVRQLKDGGYTVLGQMSQTILETAYNMRGIPRFRRQSATTLGVPDGRDSGRRGNGR